MIVILPKLLNYNVVENPVNETVAEEGLFICNGVYFFYRIHVKLSAERIQILLLVPHDRVDLRSYALLGIQFDH